MAFLLKNSTISSHFRSQSQDAFSSISQRKYHVEPGHREQALLAKDPALSKFKSYKKSVRLLQKVGDVLTIVVVAGCCYEIYVRATMREEARRNAGES